MKFKYLRHLLYAGLLSSSLLIGSSAEAAIVTKFVPMLTYADHTVPTYDKPGGGKKGFISPNVSLVYIKEIRPDGWAYGSYRIANNKRIYRWFRMQDLQGYTNFKNYTTKFNYDQRVYRTTAQATKTGSLVSNQEVIVVGALGDQLKVIYKVGGGNEYKMGWIGTPTVSESEEESEEYDDSYEDDEEEIDSTNSGGMSPGNGHINIYGGTINVGGSVDASFNDSSITDNSRNDNSTNVNDNSTNDNRSTTSTKNIDNSRHSNTRNTDNRGAVTNNTRGGRGGRNAMIIGDVNRNGKVNISDAVDLLRYLSGETDTVGSKRGADVNQDGNITDEDVVLLIKKLRSTGMAVGDVNRDGKLDDKDLKLLKAHISGSAESINAKEADLNGDSRVNAADVNIFEKLLSYIKSRNLKIEL